MIILILSIDGTEEINRLDDPITGECYYDFKYLNANFSFHNPYGGVYGYWIFCKISEVDLNKNKNFIRELKKICNSLNSTAKILKITEISEHKFLNELNKWKS